MSAAELLAALAGGGVRFVLVGGIAAVVQGAPVVTFDVDIVHDRSADNVRALVAVLGRLEAVYARGPGAEPIAPREELLLGDGHHILTTRLGRLDVLGRIEGGRGYSELVPRSVELPVGAVRVRVLTLAALLEVKRESSRPKDRALLPILEAVLRRTAG